MDLTREQQDRLILILRFRLGCGLCTIAKALGRSRCSVECAYYRMMGTTRRRAQDPNAPPPDRRYDRYCRTGNLSTDSFGFIPPKGPPRPVRYSVDDLESFNENARFALTEAGG